MSRAGPVSRASPVFRDLGTPVKRNKKQLSDYMTMQQKATFRLHDKLKIFHVIPFNRKKNWLQNKPVNL